jgi:hypothetical protein
VLYGRLFFESGWVIVGFAEFGHGFRVMTMPERCMKMLCGEKYWDLSRDRASCQRRKECELGHP